MTLIYFNYVGRQSITLISNNPFSLAKGSFIYRAHRRYREQIKGDLGKYWIKDLTDFKPPVKRIRNDVVPLVAVIRADLNKLKACVIVAVKLIGELNTLLIAL